MYEQSRLPFRDDFEGNTIALWASDHIDRIIDLIVWHAEIPVTWFQAFNPFITSPWRHHPVPMIKNGLFG